MKTEIENLKALANNRELNFYQKADALNELNELLKYTNELEDALDAAVNGLEWKKENEPLRFDKADDEKLFEWKKLLKL